MSNAWIYFIVYATGGVTASAIVAAKRPELFNDRGKVKQDAKTWDKALILGYFVTALIITPLICGFSVRENAGMLPDYFLYIALALHLISLYFSFVPMLYNPYFEGNVRIQAEKEHKVIDKGPYSIVRHPGYVGMILGSVALGLAFCRVWGIAPVAVLVVLVVIRTYLEDKTLQNELAGYKEYTERVKYRLIPFIW